MPRTSQRKAILKRLDHITATTVKHVRLLELLGIRIDPVLKDIIYCCRELQNRTQGNRFLGTRVYKKRTERFEELLSLDNDNSLTDREFLVHFRMTRDRFWALHELIKNHQIFKPRADGRGRPKGPASYQLMVLLKYYGCQGNGGSNPSLSRFFGVSAGRVKDYRDNAVKALLTLEDKAYFWPGPEERKRISTRIKRSWHFPNCVGLIDGTLLPLEFRPELHGENYLSRKKFYAIVMLIVCDDQGRILYYHIGWPGSVHDNRVWRTCRMNRKSNLYFNDQEYLLGDSAFTPSQILVPAFKSPPGQAMGDNETAFNTLLAKPRVKSEHCIGIFKGRFPFLKSIRMKIRRKEDLEKIIDYVRGSAILHNCMIQDPIDHSWLESGEEDDNASEEATGVLNEVNEGRREQLMAYLGELDDTNIY